MPKDVIIACDFSSKKETLEFLDLFSDDRKPYVKIGMELYYAEGPDIVRELKHRGHKVFLDLKLHDIPNTVMSAMKVLRRLGVDMTNVHAAGGIKMMRAALEGLTGTTDQTSAGSAMGSCDAGKSPVNDTRPTLIAVTQLTSTSTDTLHDELLIERDINDVITRYAKNAKTAGLGGVVCSPLEAKMIHENCGKDFITVTPGVRLQGAATDDQNRVTTPEMARELGSDYIVVGRPITRADDPVDAYNKFIDGFLGA